MKYKNERRMMWLNNEIKTKHMKYKKNEKKEKRQKWMKSVKK